MFQAIEGIRVTYKEICKLISLSSYISKVGASQEPSRSDTDTNTPIDLYAETSSALLGF